jgi:hypothetical protein
LQLWLTATKLKRQHDKWTLWDMYFTYTRVARWYIFIPKIPIWYTLEGLGTVNVGIFWAIWYVLWAFGIFCSHLLHDTFFPILVCCTNKNLQLTYTCYIKIRLVKMPGKFSKATLHNQCRHIYLYIWRLIFFLMSLPLCKAHL